MDIEGTTPPVPDSSPAGIDNMDISPLPHKMPYFVAQVTLKTFPPLSPSLYKHRLSCSYLSMSSNLSDLSTSLTHLQTQTSRLPSQPSPLEAFRLY
jgi:hypothetical protein